MKQVSPRAVQLDLSPSLSFGPFVHHASHSIITRNSGLHLPPRFGSYEGAMGAEPAASPAVSSSASLGWLAGNRRHLSSTALLVIRKEKCLHDLHYMQETLVSWPSTQSSRPPCCPLRFHSLSLEPTSVHALSVIPCTLTWHTSRSHTSFLAGQWPVVRAHWSGWTCSIWLVLQSATSHHRPPPHT